MIRATAIDGSTNECPTCGGKASWGYGYAAGPLGSYLMCETCCYVLKFIHDGDEGDAQCVQP